MAPAVFVVLLYGHVVSAIAWLGGGILITFVVGPGVRGLSPMANLEFTAKVLPKILRFIQASIGTTFLFGLLLFYYLGVDATSSASLWIDAGIGVALIAAAVVFGVTVPSFKKVIKMAQEKIASGAQGPPPPEMMKFGTRARMGSIAGVSLLLVVVLLMISAAVGL
ncbi:MAG: hypothetical protein HY247_04930 [archaeon]|nr:MAG: hypothetical protein HY247_04930 [archaeon]